MKNIFDTRRLRANEVIVHNGYSGTIPASSFAMITGYDKTNQHFDVDRPDVDFMDESEILIIPEAIVVGSIGVGILDNIGIVEETSGETIAAGDTVGTDTDEFTAIKGSGGFRVLYDDAGTLVLKRVASSPIHKAYCKTDAGAGLTLVCYLDVDATGTEITVNFSIARAGANLNASSARLKDGDLLFVAEVGADWYCVGSPFAPSEDCDCVEP